MKYKIVTKRNYESEIEAESPEDAIIQFATFMNMDMNLYFEAHQDLELDQYVGESMEEYDYLSQEEFDKVKAKLRQLVDEGWEVPKMVACIYDLFQEYIISEIQEQILYQIADPFEDYNECSKYWYEMDYDNPLLQILR